jgi:hypothetical protein
LVYPATFATFKEAINSFTGCTSSDCHGTGNHTGLDLQTEAGFLDRITTGTTAKCGGRKFIEPGNPDESAIVKAMEGTCEMLERMPRACIEEEFSSNCMSPDYVASIRAWIAAGATE